MEVRKENISFEISDFEMANGERSFIERINTGYVSMNNYGYILIVSLFLIGIIMYKWIEPISMIDTESFLDKIERKITEWKNMISFYNNKVLLYLNMEGGAIKSTQSTSYSSFSKMNSTFF
jgi:hypothetical protein